MEDGSGDQDRGESFPPVAAMMRSGHDGDMPLPDAQHFPPAFGLVRIGARALRYRIDRTQAWSYLHPRFSSLARPTGKVIRVYPSAPRAAEKVLDTPWGSLLVVVWELGPDLDLVGGREALGGPSPNPWRPFLFTDCPKVGVDAGDGRGPAPGSLKVSGFGKQIGGDVVLFPRTPAR